MQGFSIDFKHQKDCLIYLGYSEIASAAELSSANVTNQKRKIKMEKIFQKKNNLQEKMLLCWNSLEAVVKGWAVFLCLST